MANKDLKGTCLISQFSNSKWRFADTLHVSVAVVELLFIWVPRSGALSVGVVAEDAETSVVRSDDILLTQLTPMPRLFSGAVLHCVSGSSKFKGLAWGNDLKQ